MEHDAAHDLHAVRAHTKHPAGCLADGCEGLGEKIVERFAAGQARFELLCLGFQFFIGELFIRLFEGHDLVDRGGELFDLALRARSEHFCKQSHRYICLPAPKTARSNFINS